MQEHSAQSKRGASHPFQYNWSSIQCQRASSVSSTTNPSNMSHLEQDLPGMTTYSDEISMGSGNGSNGVPTLFVVVPSAVEEPEASLVPQIALQ